MHLRGQIIDIPNQRIFPGVIEIADGKIVALREDQSVTDPGYLCPGFIDAHVHIESSMLTPPEFARIAVTHGTVGTVSDPHEIANVLGIEGVRYMQKLAAQTPCKIHFGIPSCVPATNFETAGATLGPDSIEELCRDKSLLYLSEMMNYPGDIHRDPEVMQKIDIAKQYGKRIDGHAPGLRGEDLKKYVSAGIETDHECFQIDEAREKLSLGQNILIREGSAAKNFEELWPLLNEAPESCMLCSDDKHPDDLMEGHINQLCARAVADPSRDILKITVVNRYKDAPPATAFVRGVGLKSGAIASSVAHDCHNIVAIGTSDEDLARVINLLIQNEGGIAAVGPNGLEDVLPLPVAGLMSDGYAEEVAAAYVRLTRTAKSLGSPLHAPYMTLSFLALLVIPALKLSDLGLFDGHKFAFVPVSDRA